jgi:hypothetical protein
VKGARWSVFEAWLNAAIGLVLSWVVTYLALPIWGLAPSAGDAAEITAAYFVVSFARVLLIREVFRRWT